MLMNADQSTLVLIDLQKKLMPVISHGNLVLAESVRLARIARLLKVPVIATEQIPEKLGRNDEEIAGLADQTVTKIHFDACGGGLVNAIPTDRKQVIIGGCEAHVCMLQTALSLLAAGFGVWVVENATGSRHDNDRDAALERLQQAGATIVTVEMVAFEWMQHCEHPHFREIQKLIK
ncbi:isochorismatase family protein [Marinobacter sp. 71-i]|uniref:Isochorismatase family protein n=1 Tax=Marinobacter iranensis TaxID=2962607 RepID=A0ABT5YA97_9GAMM|nr:isochorismatase family protein [Marinobacter iranensis]MDF0750590.1 isochorismatase family protein [Marinobacter iranensis]